MKNSAHSYEARRQYKTVLHTKVWDKVKEALNAVGPIVIIVVLLCFTVAPVNTGVLLEFLTGALFVIVGMGLFTLGAEMSMSPMGERVGGSMVRSRKIWMIILFGFILGFIITISEPDLQVLAGLVPSVPDMTLILAVSLGVGIFLVLALLRIVFGIPLAPVLLVFYALVFVLACFVPEDFLAVAFDAGGVTTGPMTVPFIMALGVGISSIRGDKNSSQDSFGIVSLCSIGPIAAVLILGMVYPAESSYTQTELVSASDTVQMSLMFFREIPEYLLEMAKSLLPVIVFFAIFQIFTRDINKRTILKIGIGLLYTYIGLVLFLTGANVGFMPAGSYLGSVLASPGISWILIPIGMVIGYFIVKAEPAVYVLMKQVAEITDGAVTEKAMQLSLSTGVAVSVGLSMLRVLTGLPIMYLLIPGYAIALILTFFAPKIFTAIAFDSGGVASGPMTSAFLLPLAQGACQALGGNVVTDAFGVVAMVALTPLITIQVLGLVYKIRGGNLEKREKFATAHPESVNMPDVSWLAQYEDDEIIAL